MDGQVRRDLPSLLWNSPPAPGPVGAGAAAAGVAAAAPAAACKTRETPKAEENGDAMKESFDCEGGTFRLIDVEWKDGRGGFDACVKESNDASALKSYKVLSKGDVPGGRGKFWKLNDLYNHYAREWTCIKNGERWLQCDAKIAEKEPDTDKFISSCETLQPE